MDFCAVDVETANAQMASICQIGVARYEAGTLADSWTTLIDPEDGFDPINISVHGIEPHMVAGSPTLPQVAAKLRELVEGRVAVCHTHFDRVSFEQAFKKHSLAPLATTWLDSALVARRTWPEVAWGGYGLANVCRMIGYEFRHHDALEDAKAAAQVLLAAMRQSGRTLADWQTRVRQPIDGPQAVRRPGNPEGDLFGNVVCFTGALQIPRHQAAELAAQVGCEVETGVTRHTTILVVGDQDLRRLHGHEKSGTHRKAEELASRGQRIRIIGETDFKALVAVSAPPRQ